MCMLTRKHFVIIKISPEGQPAGGWQGLRHERAAAPCLPLAPPIETRLALTQSDVKPSAFT